jgi:hypothetical protein
MRAVAIGTVALPRLFVCRFLFARPRGPLASDRHRYACLLPSARSSHSIDAMNSADRPGRLSRPYHAPACQVGDTLTCAVRGRRLVVGVEKLDTELR